MQYILTQQEFLSLTPVKRLQERDEALEKAKEVILKLSSYSCIHDNTAVQSNYGGYCDDCPVSFRSVGHKNSDLLCNRLKNYSK